MSKVFVIGDTHFLHDNIVKYCDRPENHEEIMIENWQRVVTDEDVVFHVGDIAAAIRGREDRLVEIFKSLPGKKFLAKGNHDHKSTKFYKEMLGFEEVAPWFILDDILLCHYPLVINQYSKEKEIQKINELKKLVEDSGITKIIHGHIHNRSTGLSDHYNVSVEEINYTPISLDDLLS